MVFANVVEVVLLVFAFDGLAFAVNNSLSSNLWFNVWRLGYDAVRIGITFNDLELDGTHTTTHEEEITLANRTHSF